MALAHELENPNITFYKIELGKVALNWYKDDNKIKPFKGCIEALGFEFD